MRSQPTQCTAVQCIICKGWPSQDLDENRPVLTLKVMTDQRPPCVMQAHFSRTPLSGDMLADQHSVVTTTMRLLHALVDVVSSKNHLSLCLLVMEMCQMTTQAMWDKDSPLLQVPGFTHALAKRCEKAGTHSFVFCACGWAVHSPGFVCVLFRSGPVCADRVHSCHRVPLQNLGLS